MPTYTVEWSVELDAEDVADAVRQAFGMMQDPQTTATYLRVIRQTRQESDPLEEVFADFGDVLRPCLRCGHPESEHADYPESSRCMAPGCACDGFLTSVSS